MRERVVESQGERERKRGIWRDNLILKSNLFSISVPLFTGVVDAAALASDERTELLKSCESDTDLDNFVLDIPNGNLSQVNFSPGFREIVKRFFFNFYLASLA